jgi:Ca2+-binding RTX toxin-like protein
MKKRRVALLIAAMLVLAALASVPASAGHGVTCNGVHVPNDSDHTGTPGNDVLSGDASNEAFNGLGGNDTIHGNGGNDNICGSSGDDKLFGNTGDDAIDGGSGADEIDVGQGFDVFVGAGAGDTIFGNEDADTGSGEDGPDEVRGQQGRDIVFGGDGNDDLFGGDGTFDELYGNFDDDALDGGNGTEDYCDSGPGSDATSVNCWRSAAGLSPKRLGTLRPTKRCSSFLRSWMTSEIWLGSSSTLRMGLNGTGSSLTWQDSKGSAANCAGPCPWRVQRLRSSVSPREALASRSDSG